MWNSCHNPENSPPHEITLGDCINKVSGDFVKRLEFYECHNFTCVTPLTEIAQAALAEGEIDIYNKTCYLMSLLKEEVRLCL